jgi:hypothetical protein
MYHVGLKWAKRFWRRLNVRSLDNRQLQREGVKSDDNNSHDLLGEVSSKAYYSRENNLSSLKIKYSNLT